MIDNQDIKVYKSEKIIQYIKDGFECEVIEMIDGHYIIDSLHVEFQEGKIPGVLYGVYCYDQFIPENNSKTEIYLKNGECHREDGPAMIFPDGLTCWYYEGNLHREGGPAIEDLKYDERVNRGHLTIVHGEAMIGSSEYWLDGVRYTQEDYVKINRDIRIDKIIDGDRLTRNKRIDKILKNKRNK